MTKKMNEEKKEDEEETYIEEMNGISTFYPDKNGNIIKCGDKLRMTYLIYDEKTRQSITQYRTGIVKYGKGYCTADDPYCGCYGMCFYIEYEQYYYNKIVISFEILGNNNNNDVKSENLEIIEDESYE